MIAHFARAGAYGRWEKSDTTQVPDTVASSPSRWTLPWTTRTCLPSGRPSTRPVGAVSTIAARRALHARRCLTPRGTSWKASGDDRGSTRDHAECLSYAFPPCTVPRTGGEFLCRAVAALHRRAACPADGTPRVPGASGTMANGRGVSNFHGNRLAHTASNTLSSAAPRGDASCGRRT